MITVVNLRKHEPTDNDIYVGRGSPLGNPKHITYITTREDVIAHYKEYLPKKLAAKDREICDEMNRIYRAAKKGDVNLVCFCKPNDCHADFIKQLIEEKLCLQKEITT